ncbi:MAG: peptidase C1 [Planctomycetota bacterium]|nr:MAG: peptidase C1 [Planctomycetota bacterium]
MANSLGGYELTATKDPLDLRDLMYEGSLIELPRWVDNRGKVPFVLDQGTEGSCTGYGLAATVNFLAHNKRGAAQLERPSGASAWMLYQMAKRYDEWDGTDYGGSSIRGAMKGWHKHGVCREAVWPSKKKGKRLTTKRQMDALDRPLGNYFRVRHLHLSHVHSALAEVGVLYASADVHSGWMDPDPETGRIEYSSKNAGGHAFAIVGYDDEGLWIQNSWGRDWGLNGFGHLTYDDWMENGFDCWVARGGVVTRSVVLESGGAQLSRVQAFEFLPHEAAVTARIRPHMINLGNDGELSSSGRYRTDEEDLKDIFKPTGSDEPVSFADYAARWGGTPKLMLYAHGGLNNEKASAARIASMRPYFLQNEIYPLHFMWETGVWETLKSMLKDVFRARRFHGLWDSVKDRLADLADEAIELAVRPAGRPVWREMQENGERASDDGHGADLVAKTIADYKANGGKVEVHLVGHSAGSILLSNLVPVLDQWSLKVKTMTLYAPACSTALLRDTVIPNFGAGRCVDRLSIFNLSDRAERNDSVAKVYHKSLLYLVSEALDVKRKTPILGMQRHLTDDDPKRNADAQAILHALGAPVKKGRHTVIYSKRGANVRLASNSTTHGGFDNDVKTLDSTLRIIRGSNDIEGFPN